MISFPFRVVRVEARVENGRKLQTIQFAAAPAADDQTALLGGGLMLELSGVMLSHAALDQVLWLSLDTEKNGGPPMAVEPFTPTPDPPQPETHDDGNAAPPDQSNIETQQQADARRAKRPRK